MSISLDRLHRLASPAFQTEIARVDKSLSSDASHLEVVANGLESRISTIQAHTSERSATQRLLLAGGEALGKLQPGDVEALPNLTRLKTQLTTAKTQTVEDRHLLSAFSTLFREAAKGTRISTFVEISKSLQFLDRTSDPVVGATRVKSAVRKVADQGLEAFVSDPFSFGGVNESVYATSKAAVEAIALADQLDQGDVAAEIAKAFLSSFFTREYKFVEAKQSAPAYGEACKPAIERCTDRATVKRFKAAAGIA